MHFFSFVPPPFSLYLSGVCSPGLHLRGGTFPPPFLLNFTYLGSFTLTIVDVHNIKT